MKPDPATTKMSSAAQDGWAEGGNFLNSVLAGTLLGLGADFFLGTEPWLVVSGVVVGSYAGFVKVWSALKSQGEFVRDR